MLVGLYLQPIATISIEKFSIMKQITDWDMNKMYQAIGKSKQDITKIHFQEPAFMLVEHIYLGNGVSLDSVVCCPPYQGITQNQRSLPFLQFNGKEKHLEQTSWCYLR